MPPAQSKPNFVRHAPGSLSGGFRLRKNQICCHMLDPTQPGKHATSQAMAYFGDQQQLSTLVLNYGDWQTNKKSGGHIPLHYVQFVKYDVTVSFMAQVLDTVTYLVPQVLDTAS